MPRNGPRRHAAIYYVFTFQPRINTIFAYYYYYYYLIRHEQSENISEYDSVLSTAHRVLFNRILKQIQFGIVDLRYDFESIRLRCWHTADKTQFKNLGRAKHGQRHMG